MSAEPVAAKKNKPISSWNFHCDTKQPPGTDFVVIKMERTRKMRKRMSSQISADDIKLWRTKTENVIAHNEKGIIQGLYDNIRNLYGELLRCFGSEANSTSRRSKPIYRRLESGYVMLLVWACDYGANDGKLDKALAVSRKLENETLRIMIDICVTLTQDLLPLLSLTPGSKLDRINQMVTIVSKAMEDASLRVQPGQEELCGSEDSESYPNKARSVEEAVNNLKEYVEDLVDLGPSIIDPIPDEMSDEESRRSPDRNWEPVQNFCEQIRAKFPRCNSELAKACARSVYETLLLLEESRYKESQSYQAAAVSQEQTLPKRDDFVDSGLGSSIPTPQMPGAGLSPIGNTGSVVGSSIGATVLSFTARDGAGRSRFPPQPENVAIGDKFPCRACGFQVIKTKSLRAWKNHLLSDLRPWICCQVACSCSHRTYSSREEWLRHLRAEHSSNPHWDDKTCPFCQDYLEGGQRAMIRHVELHLQHISLAAIPGGIADEDEEEDDDNYNSEECENSEAELVVPPIPEIVVVGEAQNLSWEKVKSHPVYVAAAKKTDGLWHCPWEGEDCCQHEPTKLKTELDKNIFHHLDSFTCKFPGCFESGQPFSSFEGLRLHQQDSHREQRKGDRPYLCTSIGCGRSRPGNGFSNEWVLQDHIKGVHGNLELQRKSADM